MRTVQRALLKVLLIAAGVAVTTATVYKAGSRETALLTFEFSNGTASTVPAAMGTFGDQPYARALRCSPVYYSDLLFECGQDCEYACKKPRGLQSGSKLPSGPFCLLVIMAGRGRCEFYEQALHAQEIGAAAVILIDHYYPLDVPTYPPRTEAVDGQANVTIPVVSTLRSVDTDELTTEANLSTVDGEAVPSVVIDFTDSIARTDKVEVVLFGTERDLCEQHMGSYCERKINFIRLIAGWMVRLAREENLQFRYRSLLVRCSTSSSTYCDSHCTNKGRYCVRRPPNGVSATGADVVKHMAFSECVNKIGELSEQPGFWWDFKLLDDERCKMNQDSLTIECAEGVVRTLKGEEKLRGGIEAIHACMGDFENDAENSLLERAYQDSLGNEERSEILFDPTYVINGAQYMGRWTRAGFSDGQVPDLCLDNQVSFDECAPGEYGDMLCRNGEDHGKTYCRNTFRGFTCECDPSRFSSMTNPEDPDAPAVCKDKNECLTLSLEEECTCERCACHNTYGGYECESNIPRVCDLEGENQHGGCWHAVIKGKQYSACVDRISRYQEKASKGQLERNENGTFNHDMIHTCKCPEGFEGDGVENCTPLCKDNPTFYLKGAGCVEKSRTIGAGIVAGWVVVSLCMALVGVAAVKVYSDKKKMVSDPQLNQKLLGNNPMSSDTILATVSPDEEEMPTSTAPVLGGGDMELPTIGENSV
ncbi:hypothetical protein BSKO_00713 [Bryopsis sp. KO-2023]|nr:hypothetical protein BSKO_00713 [Bryopsis sp. KO-2023]